MCVCVYLSLAYLCPVMVSLCLEIVKGGGRSNGHQHLAHPVMDTQPISFLMGNVTVERTAYDWSHLNQTVPYPVNQYTVNMLLTSEL